MFHPGIRTSSHPRFPPDPLLMVLFNRTVSNKTSKKKKHISQVQGGQTLTYVPHIRTGYRYERINLRDLSFHVRSAYVYALVWHMSHFSYNLWVTRGIRPILIELDIYFLLLKAQSLPKKKQESVENFYLYQIEQKGTFPPGISPPFFILTLLFCLSLADSLLSLL